MQPLPLVPPGSVAVSNGASFLEDAEGGAVFIWGLATFTWSSDDVASRRLAAVQLVETSAASQREVSAAFGANETTLWRWRASYASDGLAGLLDDKKGPKRPSKLTEDKVAEIVSLREQGQSLAAIAADTGVSPNSVRRACGEITLLRPPVEPPRRLEPLATPADRSSERQAARQGLLVEAAPVICEGSHLPGVGSLVILPALDATGLLDVAARVYGEGRKLAGTTRAAFYGIRSLILSLSFACLLGEPRVEGMTRLDPVAIGRLIGLDRAPEVRRLRVRMAELAGEGRSDELVMSLARRHIDQHPEAVGLLYVDGHVRAYHGKAELPKAHLARMRISMPAEVDTFVSDRFGDGLLVWQAPPGASLAGELKEVARRVRELVGDDARPTICFDRGGWSPKLFRQLGDAGFEILTYRKGPTRLLSRSAFVPHVVTDEMGREHDYLLADQAVRIAYDSRRHYFACRQVTRLDEATGHQTQVLTTRSDPDAGLIAHAMFSRWRQENFFRYGRQRFALDALDSYETEPDDPGRRVKNPVRLDADAAVRQARDSIGLAEAEEGRCSVEGLSTSAEVAEAMTAARAELVRREHVARSIPAKVTLGELRPMAARLDVERKRLHDAVRMATYNAESALARMIAPHYARAEDEARSLLRETYKASGDLEIVGTTLQVRIAPLSAGRRTRAMKALCAELSATETTYPGTDFVLVYSMKDR
ncbi:MAG: putative transposase [Acidimicrobiales bacterium]